MTGPLDRFYAEMAARPDDDGARLAYFAALAAQELVVPLRSESDGATLDPLVIETEAGAVVPAFDDPARLADLAPGPVPFAALAGRELAALLAGQGVGLGVNLGTDQPFLIGPEGVAWLAAMVAAGPDVARARPVAFHPPGQDALALLPALEGPLARLGGIAAAAVLASAEYPGGARGAFLGILGCAPGAEETVSRALAEALRFAAAGGDGALDVAFIPGGGAAAALLRAGVRVDFAPDPASLSAAGAPRLPRLRAPGRTKTTPEDGVN